MAFHPAPNQLHEPVPVIVTHPRGGNRFLDGKVHIPSDGPQPPLGEGIPGATYDNWKDVKSHGDGYHERPLLEGEQHSVGGPGPLRRDDKGNLSIEDFRGGGLQGGHRVLMVSPVKEEMTPPSRNGTEDGYF